MEATKDADKPARGMEAGEVAAQEAISQARAQGDHGILVAACWAAMEQGQWVADGFMDTVARAIIAANGQMG